MLRRDGKLFGIEIKRADAPRLTPSIRIALDDLGLERVVIVYPGLKKYSLAERVKAIPLQALADKTSLLS